MTASSLNLGPYRYRPTKQLDETRMSTLWLASEVTRDSTASPGNQVIIKIARMTERQYSLTNQRAIENEEKWLVNLDHPNIIRPRVVAERQSSQRSIYRARSELPGNPWFLVTDYLPGGDLQSLLSEHRKLPASLALEIAEQLCDALAYLHERSCVHCDIKPRNILFHERPAGYGLTEATRPIVIDFGIAKNPTEGPQLASGTPRWITPELYEALRIGRKIEVNPTWDTYAAALVLYTMATGRKPELDNPGSHSWQPLTPADLAGDPTVKDAKQLADGLNRLIAGATADRIDERTAAQPLATGVRTLKQYVRKPGAVTVPVSRPQRSVKGLWLAFAGSAAALMLVGVLFLSGVLPSGSGQNGGVIPVPESSSGRSTPVAMAVAAATDTQPPTVKATPRPTSTPLDTPTFTPPPTATATRTLTPTPTTAPTTPAPTPSSTPRRLTPTSTLAGVPSVTTMNIPVAPPTSTKVPTPTSTALPSPTRTPTRAPIVSTPATPSSSTPPSAVPAPLSDVRATLLGPENNADIAFNSSVTFAWQPSRALAEKECFEVVLWQGEANNWQNGWGVWSANRDTNIRRVFNADYEAASAWLKPGSAYSWGVVLIEDCPAYTNRQQSSRKLVSDVRTITYRK